MEGTGMRWLIFFCSVVMSHGSTIGEVSWQKMINEVNSAQTTWQAGESDYTRSMKFVPGSLLDGKDDAPLKTTRDFPVLRSIPEAFDSRTEWPHCKTLIHIRDQANCGSCWAVAAAETLSDRFCIKTKGKVDVGLSMEDLLSCCNECGYGCEGGYPVKAWNFFKTEGIVSGGDFDSHEGCKPYSIMPCAPKNATEGRKCKFIPDANTPLCEKRCTNSRHYKSFKKDHYKVTSYYVLNNTQAIQQEILQHGPVEASFTVYEDFMTYKSGIYRHVLGSVSGGHAVKIIGWGMEYGVPYWTVANSWSPKWGENGYFRIFRGRNECGIESRIVAGIPDVSDFV